MYYQSHSNGFARRRPKRNFHNRPSRPGGFTNFRKFSPRKSQLEGRDPSIFIKKAQGASEDSHYSVHNSFADFPIVSALKETIAKHGYTQPTPIQDQAIVPILNGRDLIGLANTGTGKTAAFLIPLIDKIFKNRNQKALIIVPTRELAAQINDEFRSFASGMGLYSSLVIGGANIRRQISDIRRNSHFVIATPGRLKDLVNRKIIHLDEFNTIVLDEVDLMVDIGFIHDIKYFISLLPQKRQSLFFSATIPPKVREILNAFVTDPVTVTVKKQDTPENVDQDIIKVVSINKKVDQLHELLIKDGFDKVLIFGRTKHGVERLYRELVLRGFKVGALHGNKSQGQRQRTLESFRQEQIKILLATDVAARGLDIDNVTHVINYEIPQTYNDYIHRIGRTGRANKKGVALTFVE